MASNNESRLPLDILVRKIRNLFIRDPRIDEGKLLDWTTYSIGDPDTPDTVDENKKDNIDHPLDIQPELDRRGMKLSDTEVEMLRQGQWWANKGMYMENPPGLKFTHEEVRDAYINFGEIESERQRLMNELVGRHPIYINWSLVQSGFLHDYPCRACGVRKTWWVKLGKIMGNC